MFARLFVALQFLLPKHLLTACVWRIARIRHSATKNFLIARFVTLYGVDTDEVALGVPGDFATFNDFFIRELQPGARPIDAHADTLTSPVDGNVSCAAKLNGADLIQAKGRNYSVQDLLATEIDDAGALSNGSFATMYLAPFNYHRVHAPFDAELIAARYVPGDLYSVNQATVSMLTGLFRRNERLVMHFMTRHGPAVLVFVGALNVGSISTPWTGEIRARKHGVVEALDLGAHSTQVKKGELLGWFNMGSTVILILPEGRSAWIPELQAGKALRVGEVIGQFSGAR